MSPVHASPYLLLTLTVFFWSTNWIIGRAVHDDVPPMMLTFLRWVFALAFLTPFVLGSVRRDWPLIRAHWRTLLLLGTVGVACHNAFAYVGLNFTTATNGVMLNSFMPVMIIAMAWMFFGERLTALQLVGVAVSLGGVLVILSRGSLDTLASFRLNIGDLFVMLAMASWSLYTVLLRRRPPGIAMLSFLFVLGVVGVVEMLPLGIAEAMIVGPSVPSARTFVAIAAVGLFSSVLAYIFWNRGVEAVGPQVAGLFVHLMPVFGVLLAWLFLGERLEPFHLAGIALILAGIGITTRRGRLPAPAGTD